MNISLLNKKSLKGEYLKDIENGIMKSFKTLYPNNEITIDYLYSEKNYYFNIYINGKTFSKKSKNIESTNILVDTYNNVEAIALFAKKYIMDDFYNKHNDYSEDNHIILEKELKKLIEEYKKNGIVFNCIQIDKCGYYIEYYHPLYSEKIRLGNKEECRTRYHVHSFNTIPISKATMKKQIRKIRKSLEQDMANYVAKAIINE